MNSDNKTFNKIQLLFFFCNTKFDQINNTKQYIRLLSMVREKQFHFFANLNKIKMRCFKLKERHREANIRRVYKWRWILGSGFYFVTP